MDIAVRLVLLLAMVVLPIAGPANAAEPLVLGQHRQLFVDNYVIAEMQGVKQVLNEATRFTAAPVLKPEHPWEGVDVYLYGSVIYDESKKLFKMWYAAWGPKSNTRGCYATSPDGITWNKPNLGLIEFEGSKDNNLIPWYALGMIYSPDDPDPARRYKSLAGRRGQFSSDGLRWTIPVESKKIPGGIVSDNVIPFCYDELSDRYVAFGKVNRLSGKHGRRSVSVAFSKDFLEWTNAEMVLVPDARDDELAIERTAQLRDRVVFFEEDANLRNAQFYGMCGFPYEGMYLGLLWVFDISGWTPEAKKISAAGGEDGPVQVELVSSRNLLNWDRAGQRKLLIPAGAKGSWEAGQIYTVNRPIIVGDEIWIYYGGIGETHGHPMYQDVKKYQEAQPNSGIGLATLRLDGWVSIDAGPEEGTVTTKPVVFKPGEMLVINAAAPEGSIAVEILDSTTGEPLAGFEKKMCQVFRGDSVRHTVTWDGNADLTELANFTEWTGKPVSLRFYLRNTKLYSFTTSQY